MRSNKMLASSKHIECGRNFSWARPTLIYTMYDIIMYMKYSVHVLA